MSELQRFLVVGNGQPALALVSELIAAESADLAAFLTSETNGSAASLARSRSVPLYPEAMLGAAEALRCLGLSNCDWLLCANTTCIVPKCVLSWFPSRALNFHPGLLPEYAGLYPHQWAIRHGEAQFGVTIHMIEAGLDTGDIVAVRRFPISPEDTGLSLYRKCMRIGAQLFGEVLRAVMAGSTLVRQPQDLIKRRLYRKAEAMDGRIDWSLPARPIVDFIRAGNYYPFSSPTYVPVIDDFGTPSLQVLKASVADVTGRVGALIGIRPVGPVIGCGEGAVVLEKTVRQGRVVDLPTWQRLFERLSQPALSVHGP